MTRLDSNRYDDHYGHGFVKAREAARLADSGETKKALSMYHVALLFANESWAEGAHDLRLTIRCAILALGGTLS